jgi:hypothetical protein
MEGLRRICWLLDTNSINLRARYIRSVANVWADNLSRHLDNDVRRLDPVLFAEFDTMFGRQSIDRICFCTQHPTTALQRMVEGPNVRSGGRSPPIRRKVPARKQPLQPPMAPPTKPRPKTTTERRSGYSNRPPVGQKSMAPSAYLYGFKRTYRYAPSRLVPTRALGATRYYMQFSLGSHYIQGSLPAWLYLRRGAVSATLALFTGLHREPRILNQ